MILKLTAIAFNYGSKIPANQTLFMENMFGITTFGLILDKFFFDIGGYMWINGIDGATQHLFLFYPIYMKDSII